MPLYRVFGAYRFLLAFMVLLSHSWVLHFGKRGETFIGSIGIGNVAVMGFFVLSGFVISEAAYHFYPARPGAFLLNRLLRLVPPYWAAVLLSGLLHVLLLKAGVLELIDFDVPPVAKILAWDNAAIQFTAIIPVFNVNNILGNHEWYYFVRYFWAIFVEFVFYGSMAMAMLAWPLFRRVLTLPAYAALCLAGAIAVHLVSEYVRPLHTSFAYVPYFGFGASLFAWMETRNRRAAALAILCFGLLMLHFSSYAQGHVPIDRAWAAGLARPEVWTPILMMAVAALVVLPLGRVVVSRAGAERDRAIGDLSYPLYLNHYVVTIVVISLMDPGPWAQLAAVVGSLVVSWAMMRAVERPMAGLRNRIRGTRLTAGAAPVPVTVEPALGRHGFSGTR